MKTKIIFAALLLLAFNCFLKAQPMQDTEVNFNVFYTSLAPYGEWLQLDDGVYAWRPQNVGADWKPYTIGRWTYTTDGWYWDSFEQFGWATFHYGRWNYDDNYGWIWFPDYEWAPSWCEWRYDNDNIGWSPLPVYASFNSFNGIRFSLGWHSDYRFWNFVAFNRFCSDRVYDYFIPRERVGSFFGRTNYRTNYIGRNNRIFVGGVDRNFIERRGGFRVTEHPYRSTYDLHDISGARHDSYVRVYRPSNDVIKRANETSIRNIARPNKNINIEKDRIAVRNSRPFNSADQRNNNNNGLNQRNLNNPVNNNNNRLNQRNQVIPNNNNNGLNQRNLNNPANNNNRINQRNQINPNNNNNGLSQRNQNNIPQINRSNVPPVRNNNQQYNRSSQSNNSNMGRSQEQRSTPQRNNTIQNNVQRQSSVQRSNTERKSESRSSSEKDHNNRR